MGMTQATTSMDEESTGEKPHIYRISQARSTRYAEGHCTGDIAPIAVHADVDNVPWSSAY